jgi:hypothetical protein
MDIDIIGFLITILVTLISFCKGLLKIFEANAKRKKDRDEEIAKVFFGNIDELVNSIPTMGQTEGPHNSEEILIAKERFSLVDNILSDIFSTKKHHEKKDMQF